MGSHSLKTFSKLKSFVAETFWWILCRFLSAGILGNDSYTDRYYDLLGMSCSLLQVWYKNQVRSRWTRCGKAISVIICINDKQQIWHNHLSQKNQKRSILLVGRCILLLTSLARIFFLGQPNGTNLPVPRNETVSVATKTITKKKNITFQPVISGCDPELNQHANDSREQAGFLPQYQEQQQQQQQHQSPSLPPAYATIVSEDPPPPYHEVMNIIVKNHDTGTLSRTHIEGT